ncbi:MAG TPA: ATP synthase F1 subunit gamma [Thermosulfidibacter takaii]|uniref:ATP synthase gamma chain n=1 Tax=Thermosulfidibacter takaii TaxID=412593 RepID=A0A7C0U6F3_9BACT|nr:ATP synthase F1 subunit gamma [Thermosulfidibacter takaii]
MSGNLRDMRRKIASIKSTQKITNTMKLVAAAKFRRAQNDILLLRPYAYKMHEMASSLALRANPELHPLLAKREENKILLVVVTSDRGLCGAFNTNILSRAEEFVREKRQEGKEVFIVAIGRKARDYFKRRPEFQVVRVFVDFFLKRVEYNDAAMLAELVTAEYVNDKYDAVYVIYNEFKSAIRQDVTVERLLPIEPIEVREKEIVVDFIYEPSPQEILDELLPLHFKTQVYRVFLESYSSEQGARMTAMDNATKNAEEMIKTLTLQYNKARQASITKEILEVVAGAEALT